MSIDTDTGASSPTLEAPYQGFWDPSISHISIMKFLSFPWSGLPRGAFRGQMQELRCRNPCGESLFLSFIPWISPCCLLGLSLNFMEQEDTSACSSLSDLLKLLSCPRSSFIRRPNLHWPLRLIANLWKKCWCLGTDKGFFLPLL